MKSKKDNIAEYVLYLWQMEDVVRALADDERLHSDTFLSELSQMMHAEGVLTAGHTQIARVAQQEMEELHLHLLDTNAIYKGAFMQLMPQLNILKSRSDNPTQSDIEMMLVFLYNIMLLHLQRRPISEQTLAVQQQVSKLLQMLSAAYKNDDYYDDQATL